MQNISKCRLPNEWNRSNRRRKETSFFCRFLAFYDLSITLLKKCPRFSDFGKSFSNFWKNFYQLLEIVIISFNWQNYNFQNQEIFYFLRYEKKFTIYWKFYCQKLNGNIISNLWKYNFEFLEIFLLNLEITTTLAVRTPFWILDFRRVCCVLTLLYRWVILTTFVWTANSDENKNVFLFL